MSMTDCESGTWEREMGVRRVWVCGAISRVSHLGTIVAFTLVDSQ